MNKYLTTTLFVGLSLTAPIHGAEYRTPSPGPQESLDSQRARTTEHLRQQRLVLQRLSPEERQRIREENTIRRQAETDRQMLESLRRASSRRRRRARTQRQRNLEALSTGHGRGKRIYGRRRP